MSLKANSACTYREGQKQKFLSGDNHSKCNQLFLVTDPADKERHNIFTFWIGLR